MIIFQTIIAILLIAAILLQSQGTGLGSAFGGEGTSYHTKQGLEKIIFRVTILLVLIFVAASLYTLIQ